MSSALSSPKDRETAEPESRSSSTARLHPSVRFYRGVWGLSQLADPAFTDANHATSTLNSTTMSSSAAPSATAASPPRRLSVVRLHQTLLPPAPVDGLGEIADESYAVQLASTDGLEYLRLHWHLLLPLLFPVGRPLVEAAPRPPRLHEADGSDEAEEGEEAAPPPEHAWTVAELYTQIMTRQLTGEDLCVLREPGLMDRVYYSYVVLLRFYGWRVHDETRGLLDRHRGWPGRYTALAEHQSAAPAEASSAAAAGAATSGTLLPLPESPPYSGFDFYRSGLPRVLRSLLDVGFLRLGVRLVEFVLEEVRAERLAFLLPLVEKELLPMIEQDPNVEGSHKTRLAKRLYQVTHSDSD